MTEPRIEDLVIYQGAQFQHAWHWYGGGKVVKAIEDLTPGCPTVIQITGHGLPSTSKTPVLIDDVKGAHNVNVGKDKCDAVLATYIDVDNFSVEANTQNQKYKAGTGCVIYYLPSNLTGWIARMQIRERINDTTPIVDLTSGAGDIVINVTDARITVTVATAVTETLDFAQAVYDLELVDPSGEAVNIAMGKVSLVKNVTR